MSRRCSYLRVMEVKARCLHSTERQQPMSRLACTSVHLSTSEKINTPLATYAEERPSACCHFRRRAVVCDGLPLSLCACVCLSLSLSLSRWFLCLSAYLSVWLSVCLAVCLSVCLNVSVSLCGAARSWQSSTDGLTGSWQCATLNHEGQWCFQRLRRQRKETHAPWATQAKMRSHRTPLSNTVTIRAQQSVTTFIPVPCASRTICQFEISLDPRKEVYHRSS